MRVTSVVVVVITFRWDFSVIRCKYFLVVNVKTIVITIILLLLIIITTIGLNTNCIDNTTLATSNPSDWVYLQTTTTKGNRIYISDFVVKYILRYLNSSCTFIVSLIPKLLAQFEIVCFIFVQGLNVTVPFELINAGWLVANGQSSE